ncbi:unnamed protein product, partial [Durusdinium trenchii]
DQKRMDNHNQMKREQYEPDEPAGVWAEYREEKAVEDISDEDESLGSEKQQSQLKVLKKRANVIQGVQTQTL